MFGNLRKSSDIFGKCSETFVWPSDNFWEIFGECSEIFGKSSKKSLLVCLYNKQNITCQLVDTNFIFSCSTRYLTRSLRSLVRYRVEHSKIKFVSTRGHVISSMCHFFSRIWFSIFNFFLAKMLQFLIFQSPDTCTCYSHISKSLCTVTVQPTQFCMRSLVTSSREVSKEPFAVGATEDSLLNELWALVWVLSGETEQYTSFNFERPGWMASFQRPISEKMRLSKDRCKRQSSRQWAIRQY